MKREKLTQFIQFATQQYQKIENYFTSGSFGVKFYPILMYPCVRNSQSFVVKSLAVLSVFLGLYFLFGELVTILFTDEGLAAYANHTLFELSLPIGTIIDERAVMNSPLSFVMQASFLLQGYLFAVIYLLGVMRITRHIRLIAALLAIGFACCLTLIPSAQGGKFTLGGLQNLGVSITFLLGNLTMIITGLTTLKSPALQRFKWFSLFGGLVGLAAIVLTILEPTAFLPLLERVSFYLLLAWEIAAGFMILRQVK